MIRSMILVAGLFALVGCSDAAADDTESGAGASSQEPTGDQVSAGASSRATIKDLPIKEASKTCTIDLVRPVVEVPGNAVATAAIAKAFEDEGVEQSAPPAGQSFCSGGGDSMVSVDGEYSVTTNAKGILSVHVNTNNPQPNPDKFVFDLSTGKHLSLGDVLTKAGIDKVKAACAAGSESIADPSSCDNISSSSKDLEVTTDSLIVMLDVFNEIAIPWKNIDRTIASPAIVNFLKR